MSSANDTLTVQALDHVVLRVTDVERSIAFYTSVFGCEVERKIEELGLTQLRAGASLIDLVDVASPLGRAGAPPAGEPEFGGRNLDHFALRVTEFDEGKIRDHLARHNVEASETGRRYGADGYGPSIYLKDPDGNTVELKGPATSDEPSSALDRTQREVLSTAFAMDACGLTEGTAGNLSARAPGGEIVLTPTALAYPGMELEDLVVTDLEGNRLAGHRAPTTEIDLHLACLRRYPEVGAVVHTHAVHASMFAVLNEPIPCVLEEFEYYVGGDVLVAPYHRTGTAALGEAVADKLGDRAAALIANHGLVVVAGTAAEALQLTKLVDRAARIIWGARSIGKPQALPAEVRREFREGYLQRRQASRSASAD